MTDIIRRIKTLEEKANMNSKNEELYISWECNEGCKGKAALNFCPHRKAQANGGVIWLPCGEGCEGI